MATLADIHSQDWSFSVAGLGQVVEGIDDIAQCINIILATQKGTDPFRPNFGADILRFVDKPVNASIPGIIREMTEQIKLWEPRAKLTKITPTIDVSSISFKVEFQTTLGNGSTTLNYSTNG